MIRIHPKDEIRRRALDAIGERQQGRLIASELEAMVCRIEEAMFWTLTWAKPVKAQCPRCHDEVTYYMLTNDRGWLARDDYEVVTEAGFAVYHANCWDAELGERPSKP